jgi:hypothetical protein
MRKTLYIRFSITDKNQIEAVKKIAELEDWSLAKVGKNALLKDIELREESQTKRG